MTYQDFNQIDEDFPHRYDVEQSKIDYPEFKGEMLSPDESIGEEDREFIKVFKPMPLSIGFEVEQPSHIIPDIFRYQGGYDWFADGSGPIEMLLKPAKLPSRQISKLIKKVNKLNSAWKWQSQYISSSREYGCGSHIHFAVRNDITHYDKPGFTKLDQWATAYNTILETAVMLLPLFTWGIRLDEMYSGNFRVSYSGNDIQRLTEDLHDNFAPRSSMTYWAKFSPRRYSNLSTQSWVNGSSTSREYKIVTFNGAVEESDDGTTGKPLTIEIRSGETHPAFSYFASFIVNRIVRSVFEMELPQSPKLLQPRATKFRKLQNAAAASAIKGVNLFDAYDEVFPTGVDFQYKFPGLKSFYPTYFDFFKAVIKKYIPSDPPLARLGRLWLAKGQPYLEWNKSWQIFAPTNEFTWDFHNVKTR